MIALYDGDCAFCRVCARALRKLDRGYRLELLDFNHPEAESLLAPLAPTERRRALHVIEPNAAISSAGPALRVALTHALGAAAGQALNLWPMVWLIDLGYELVAPNRRYLGWIERLVGRVDPDDAD